IQNGIMRRWLESGAFAATPDERERDQRYVIMMPLPNVTGALHMGHAMDNVMQDLLIRWHRMMGANTLWQPGTDHAGIATQAVVEKRLFELEGKTRHDIGREALVKRIWDWKDEYQQRIVHQQQQMGCSCDWDRQRFTMDAVCSAAVRETFFRLFADRLIYRGDRLVNWDCQLQTAVADDEVYHETTQGHFWHLRYPVIEPKAGEPKYIVVATTRPETMLGDTAVACYPDPVAALAARIDEQRKKVSEAAAKDEEAERAELERLEERKKTHLPGLELLVSMAKDGRKVMLPLQEREMPLILDEWAKPELGSGCIKITPAHDPNDYDVWRRHLDKIDRIDIINILRRDGTLNTNAGAYANMDRFAARDQVIADLKAKDLLEAVEDREVEIGHSDRSKTPIEPYLSKQWFVRMGDVDGGVTCARGTTVEFKTPGLAQAAINAVSPDWQSPSGLRLEFHPARYTGQYTSWLAEKRDWCISRQLWWGHRIPVWTVTCEDANALHSAIAKLPDSADDGVHIWVSDADGTQHAPGDAEKLTSAGNGPFEVQVCLRNPAAEKTHAAALGNAGFTQDPDVLDTWFSSAQWPFSTLGWPDPPGAPIGSGQTTLGAVDGRDDAFSYYYPGSCLVTARDIITLWVARMAIMGLYNHGDLPFTDCFVHAKILDGKGVTMSKSKGNGIDPLNIIERYGVDAMRYLICDMETGMQDVRLPVQATCPACETLVDLAEAKHGRTIFTYLCTKCKSEFDVLGTMKDVPSATVTSDRFEVGRAFCNKLWNAARFAMMNLGELDFRPLALGELAAEDRWILARLNRASQAVTRNLEAYKPSAALSTAREFFWGEFCDWYLEMIKPRMRDEKQAPVARQVLAVALDQILRLLHPFVPFITETLWERLQEQAPKRGIEDELPPSDLCIQARWPERHESWENEALEAEIASVKDVIGRLRELRSRHDIPPKKELPAAVRTGSEARALLERHAHLIKDMARLSSLDVGEEVTPPDNAATQVSGGLEIFLGGVLDPKKERARLEKTRDKILEDVERGKKKLSNEKFISKAPADVVEGERRKVAELNAQLAAVMKNLESL
ncbi:MAG: valine--tRNA ligase, partial [Myxococcota bacterium]